MGLFKSLSPVKTNRQQNVPIGSIRILAAAKNTAGSPEVTATANIATVESQAPIHRFSLRSSNFTQEVHNNALPAIEKREKPSNKVSNSDKRAKDSALALRSLIVGPTSTLTSQNFTTPNRSNIKSQLLAPKTASNVIAKLKELPASDDPLHADKKSGAKGLIHAVCLAYADAEADALHFSKLISSTGDTAELPSMVSAPVNKIVALFNDMHVIDLINAPDFGLGQPGDGPGILAGALPTAETVIEGVERITPELMALGYATGRAVMPDHSGIYPPTDRISVLTYWWGLELLLPSPSLIYVGNAQSITHALTNFLSALALVDSGIREILPFIRYISQYVDFEFNSIKGQDKGEGVVCAATWIMPAALVPRPWDFPTRPQSKQSVDSIPHKAAKVLTQDTVSVEC